MRRSHLPSCITGTSAPTPELRVQRFTPVLISPPPSFSIADTQDCSHGLYSIEICEQYPSATATNLDDEPVRDLAEAHIASAGLEDRITFEVGDYETESFASTYDMALVFNVVHGNDRKTNQFLFDKVAEAVPPGGQLAILDQFGDERRASIANTGTRFLDLAYFVSLGGRTYHTDTVKEWLRESGFYLEERNQYSDRSMTLLVATRE